jgi:hypothetical protein
MAWFLSSILTKKSELLKDLKQEDTRIYEYKIQLDFN